MWFIIKSDFHKEQEARKFLLGLEGVQDVYLPLYRQTIGGGGNGDGSHRFIPTISGILFVNVESEDKLMRLVNDWGYFKYQTEVYDEQLNGIICKTVYSSVHLLSFDPKNTDRKSIIRYARVETEDINRFRVYNEQLANNIEDLKILNLNYHQLEAENDTVVITEGPYIGFEGVIKQVKSHGRKDRKLYFRIGNWCASISNVRSYRHIVVREAVRGMKANTVNAWRHVDRLVGSLQSSGFPDDASRQLRKLLKELNKDTELYDYLNSLSPDNILYPYLSRMDYADEGSLVSLSRYFQSTSTTIDQGLLDMIPDITLRPFLTPTSGTHIIDGKDYALLGHHDFVEVIVKTDLRQYFWHNSYEEGKYSPLTLEYKKTERTSRGREKTVIKNIPLDDDDYVYYAHAGLFDCGDHITAIINWGGFYHNYALMNVEERETFHAELSAKGYDRLYSLLANSGTQSSDIRFMSLSPSIGGFAIDIPKPSDHDTELLYVQDPMEHPVISSAVRSLISECSPAAVEMWQGTRLLPWRHLIQRHVLLHKIPLRDQPHDIPADAPQRDTTPAKAVI
ncbi:MAG: hypothetical protein Q4D41_11570 [Prevotellaceae bacterium]|nr:hypothetical protein [Prevotellaceae bacterium]